VGGRRARPRDPEPTSREKILLLGDYLRLTSESRVLDVACGKGGPATILAGAFGCRVLGIELRPAFAGEARSRAAAAELEALIEIRALHERRRRVHFAYRRALLGWAIFVGRKP
jgi:cyclopropane fatty-acyl-phospholipid synthase-like methyltransferase